MMWIQGRVRIGAINANCHTLHSLVPEFSIVPQTLAPVRACQGVRVGLVPSSLVPECSLIVQDHWLKSQSLRWCNLVHLYSQRQAGQLCRMTRPSSKIYWLLQKEPLNHPRPVITLGTPSKCIYSNTCESSLPFANCLSQAEYPFPHLLTT